MTLSFIAFYMADYQRDTMHLPLEGHGAYFLLLQHCWTHGSIPADDAGRAAICKVPLARWRKFLAPLVAGYFDESGRNKRATAEIEKAEKKRLRQAMAGHKGGSESAKRKAERQAMAKPRLNHGTPMAQPRHSHGEAILEKNIINTFTGAARARDPTPDKNPTISTEPDAGVPPETPPSEPAKDLGEQARSAVATSTRSIGSGELISTLQAKRWIPS